MKSFFINLLYTFFRISCCYYPQQHSLMRNFIEKKLILFSNYKLITRTNLKASFLFHEQLPMHLGIFIAIVKCSLKCLWYHKIEQKKVITLRFVTFSLLSVNILETKSFLLPEILSIKSDNVLLIVLFRLKKFNCSKYCNQLIQHLLGYGTNNS